MECIDLLDSYSEESPSGTGIHIIVRGQLPPGRRRTAWIEMYDSGRFFTFTGRHLAGTPIAVEQRDVELHELYRRVFGDEAVPQECAEICGLTTTNDGPVEDAEVLARMYRAVNGARIRALFEGNAERYASASEADLALCAHLAFFTGGDAAQVDRMFRLSGLWRPKWDEPRGARTYGERTIAKAITSANQTFNIERVGLAGLRGKRAN